VYASTSYVKRMSLWQSLTYIHNQYNLPWSFIGVLILLQGYLLKNFQLGQIVIILFTYLLEEEPRVETDFLSITTVENLQQYSLLICQPRAPCWGLTFNQNRQFWILHLQIRKFDQVNPASANQTGSFATIS
jgi:hypothetical protein